MSSTPVLLVALAAVACSTHQKTEITEEAFADPQRRAEIMEATLRVMDAHPDYVDEFFQISMRHPRTQNRLFENNSRELATDRDLARRMAARLVAHPAGLQRIMIETVDAAASRPRAQEAIVNAVDERAEVTARFLVARPRQLANVSRALVTQAIADPNTKDKIGKLLKELIK